MDSLHWCLVIAGVLVSSCAVNMSEVRAAQAAYDRSHTISRSEEWPDEVALSFTRLRF
jgi:hypothetical protein